MIAWTKAARLAAFIIVQPDAAGVIRPGPASWYGVAQALLGERFGGRMMSQFTLAAVVVTVLLVGDGVGLAKGRAVALSAPGSPLSNGRSVKQLLQFPG